MSRACTNLSHHTSTEGEIVAEARRAVYVNLVCDTCGRSVGVRRKAKVNLVKRYHHFFDGCPEPGTGQHWARSKAEVNCPDCVARMQERGHMPGHAVN